MDHRVTKEEVRNARKEFFQDVVDALSTQPKPIDVKLEQVKYYYEPDMSSLISDADYGDFYIEINPVVAGKSWPLAYSMWQIGHQLKVAIILQSHTEDIQWAAPNEFVDLWPNSPMESRLGGGKMFLDWTFDVPDFHTDYAVRERYALGMRHLHFRTLKAVRELAARSLLRAT